MESSMIPEHTARTLRVIRQTAYNVLTGYTQQTDKPVFDARNSIYHWRTLWGMIWAMTYEGLGEDLPDPPPWPPEYDSKNPEERGELSC